MARSSRKPAKSVAAKPSEGISLKELARHLNLSTATVSLVINSSPGAKSIPPSTQERVRKAAQELNYRPNFMARSLRQKRSFTIGVMVPEISEGYGALVISGIEDYLLQEGYFYFVISHRRRPELIAEFPRRLQQRAVDGIIAVDTAWDDVAGLPAVSVSGHKRVDGVTNVVLDHDLAASLALRHLKDLGHRRIAFIKGQVFSSDSEIRWRALNAVASQIGITIDKKLVAQMEHDSSSPEVGFGVMQEILSRNAAFTAVCAFNDLSAIGAIQALREARKQVPGDVSVIGFDDIRSAAFQNPRLTTIRQPLREMGVLAAETLLKRIARGSTSEYPAEIMVKPELVVRNSTAAAPKL